MMLWRIDLGQDFAEHGPNVFGGKEEMKRAQEHQARLERMVGQKLLGIGAGGGFLAGLPDPSRHGDPRWIVIYALAFGAPTGAMAGVFLGALRRPRR